MKRESSIKFVMGFSLFAMFFGAGNLIFPTFLGYRAGTYWPVAFIIYMIADGLLAMISLYCIFSCGGLTGFVKPLGKRIGYFILICISLCIGPLIAIPRTGIITYELGVTNFGFKNLYVTTAVFFLVSYLIYIKSEKIVDFIGRYLTPILLSFLLVMFITGIVYPIGEIQQGENLREIMYDSFVNGFQTLDVMGGALFNAVIVNALHFYKIRKENEKKVIISSSLVAFISLSVVYGGLCFLGASSKLNISGAENGSEILNNFTNILFGRSGIIMLSVIVILACLTTSVALIGGVSEFFNSVFPKISYRIWVILITISSFMFSCLGIGAIIKLAVPLLFTLYPPIIILMITLPFRKKINCDKAIKYSTILSIIIGFITVLNENFKIFYFIKRLPLSSLGFGYLIPSLLLFVFVLALSKRELAK